MKYIMAATLGVGLCAGAADAAVYRYDVTMERKSLTTNLFGYGPGLSADPKIEGLPCETRHYEDGPWHTCEGVADFTENQYGIDALRNYAPVISGTFILDTVHNRPDEVDSDGTQPGCSGVHLFCGYLSGDYSSQVASPDGFSISYLDYGSYEIYISDESLLFRGSDILDFTLGNMTYSNSYHGIAAEYETTSIEIAPIPVPASLPLLGIGLAAIGCAARRRRSGRTP